MMTRPWRFCGLFTMVACLSLGCGDRLPDAPPTVEVTGTVTFEGSPLEGASVIFSDGIQFNALGETDSTGRFALKTRFHSELTSQGAPPRKYKVTIKKLVPPNGMSEGKYAAQKELERKTLEEGGRLDPSRRVPRMVQLLPKKYSSTVETILSANVTTDGKNDFPFNLNK